MATNVSYKFTGKKALVTGAGDGVGRGIAIALAKAGATTYGLSKTQAHLDSLVKESPTIKPICVDLADWTATKTAVEAIGQIDMLVNCAAVLQLASFVDVKPEQFAQSFEVNVKSVLNVTQIVAKSLMTKNAPGSIVNISSLLSTKVAEKYGIYSSTKGALDQLTRSFALELGPNKIRINSVNPTLVLTEMAKPFLENEAAAAAYKARIPLGRFAEVEDVVGPVLFLLSDASNMVNGTILFVDGGISAA
jgi:L-xylulose reductase